MNKTILIAAIILIVILIAWYFISPVFRVTELNESSPTARKSVPEKSEPVIKDSFNTMAPEEKDMFESETKKMENKAIPMMESMPMATKEGTQVIAQGVFMPRAHEVKGKALLISADEKKILRFEDFETINGPNLHIYLSSDLGGNDYVDLGAIRATKGNVNYEVPASTDTSRYNKVLVWCVPFQVLFSYAEFVL
jgi:hypothetical protein